MYILRLSLLIGFITLGIKSYGQKSDTISKKVSIIPGAQIQPILVANGILTPITFKVQMRINDLMLWPDFRFGFSSQNIELKTTHQYSYTFKGNYVQPGFLFYPINPLKYKNAFFLGFHAYFGWFTHYVNMKVTDLNWGTSQQYSAAYKNNLVGGTLEVGNISSISKRFKISISGNLAIMKPQPIVSVKLPNKLAAIGFYSNSGIGLGAAIGVHYQVY